MKTIARYVRAIAALGAVCFFAGCATTHSARRPEPAYDLTVVQSSSDRKLTPEDLAWLREAVKNFLAAQGKMDGRDYYVRVDFHSDDPGSEGEWLVVKLSGAPAPSFTLLAANSGGFPLFWDPYDVRYGSWVDPYYFDPFFFNPGPYFRPPFRPTNRWDHNGDGRPGGTHVSNDGKHDGWHGRDGRHDGDGKHDGDHHPRNNGGTPRAGETYRARDHDSGSIQVARERSGGGSYTPPARSESGGSYSPPARSEPSPSSSSSSNSGIQATSGTQKEK